MNTFKLTIEMKGDAFRGGAMPARNELARILDDLSGKVTDPALADVNAANVRDINGDVVGEWKFAWS